MPNLLFFPYRALAIRELSKNLFQVFDARFHTHRFNSKCEMCVNASYLGSLIAYNFRLFFFFFFCMITFQTSLSKSKFLRFSYMPSKDYFPPGNYIILFTKHQENSRLSLPLTYTKHVIVHGTDLTRYDLSYSRWQRGHCRACFPAVWHLFPCTGTSGSQIRCVASSKT